MIAGRRGQLAELELSHRGAHPGGSPHDLRLDAPQRLKASWALASTLAGGGLPARQAHAVAGRVADDRPLSDPRALRGDAYLHGPHQRGARLGEVGEHARQVRRARQSDPARFLAAVVALELKRREEHRALSAREALLLDRVA